ncbi:hypothetical protein Tsubulata_044636, partial [Turnera subulata]
MKAFDDSNALVYWRYVDPSWKLKRYFNVGSEASLRKNIKVIDDFVAKLISTKRNLLADQSCFNEKEDILSRFLVESKKDPEKMNDRYLRDIILNFMIAGKDTSANTLSWFFYMLCKNPLIQEKVAQEVRDVTGDVGDEVDIEDFIAKITDSTLDQMHYLHATLSETLRLYPAVPVDGRCAEVDDILPDGYRLKKGDGVNYLAYAMGRMSYIWGEDAEDFRPERWLKNGVFQPESPFKFIAFHAGPRICLGKDFAYRQMKIVSMALLRFLRFKLPDDTKDVTYKTMFTLHISRGLHLCATARTCILLKCSLAMDVLNIFFIFTMTSLLLIFIPFLYLLLKIYTGKSIGDRSFPPLKGTEFGLFFHFNRLHGHLTEVARKHKTFRLLGTGRSLVLTTDIRNIEHVLKTSFDKYSKGKHNQDIVADVFGEGIFAVDGDKWRQQRKLSSFEFSTRVLRDFGCSVFKTNAAKLARIISGTAVAGQVFDMQDILMRCTLDSIFKVGFGVELNCLSGSSSEGTEFMKAFDDSNALLIWRYVDPFWKLKRYFNVGSEASLKKNIKVIDDFVAKIISTKRKLLAEQSCYNDKEDILSRFLVESKKDPEKMNDRYLRDIILNIMFAGKDTSANTISWFFYMLCKNPLIQEKVAQEVRDVIGSQEDEADIEDFTAKLTDSTLEQMHYLHAALSETLRLYPAVPVDGRCAEVDDILPDGYRLEKGDGILHYLAYAMGRMPYIWGEDAQDFRLERWLKNGIFQPESPFKFIAFHAGPRTCLGKDFAYRQMKIVSMALLRFLRFKLADGTKNWRSPSLCHSSLKVYRIECINWAWQQQGSPSYPPVNGTVFGQLFYFNRLYDQQTEQAKEHKTFRLLAPDHSEIFTTDPRNIEHALKTRFDKYSKGKYEQDILSDLFGEGIFAVDGDKWQQQRKLSSFEFSTRVLRDFSSAVFRRNAAKLVRVISDIAIAGQVFDMQDILMRCTLDSIFKVGFGVELNCLTGSSREGTEFMKAFDDSNALVYWRYVDPFWKLKRYFNVGSEASLRKNIKNEKEDILSRFLAESRKDPEKMNDRYLRDIILNFMIAGKDTSANTLS